MKKPIFLCVLSLGLCSTLFGQDSGLSLDPGVKPHPGLDVVYAKFSRAYRDLDHEKAGGLYATEAAYLVPGENLRIGRDKITPTFRGFFDYVRGRKGALSISFRILQRRVSSDMAYDVGIFSLTQTDSEGRSNTSQGKFVVVAVKDKKGEWLFQVDGYSDLAKPLQ